MSRELINHANTVRAKYSFEIDGKLDAASFFRAKFLNDIATIKTIHNNIYKKIKK